MRTCELNGCETSLDGMRADARYCSDDHRREAARRRFNVDGARAFWSRLGGRPRQRPRIRTEPA